MASCLHAVTLHCCSRCSFTTVMLLQGDSYHGQAASIMEDLVRKKA